MLPQALTLRSFQLAVKVSALLPYLSGTQPTQQPALPSPPPALLH